MSTMDAVKKQVKAQYINDVLGLGEVTAYDTVRTEIRRGIVAMDNLIQQGWRYDWGDFRDDPNKVCCLAGAHAITYGHTNIGGIISHAARLVGFGDQRKDWPATKAQLQEMWDIPSVA